jgi:DNA-binding transcriptional ArsR family regulator
MREFLVYGFKSRDEIGTKSARSYDNEKRRIESWLGEYMSFRYDRDGKAVFLSVDSRSIPHNPLYKAWKASSFTKNDINLHFFLLDILTVDKPLGIGELIDIIDERSGVLIDESTLRKKLKEYTEIGLIKKVKQGKETLYLRATDDIARESWHEAITFFSETAPIGAIGSFLADKCGAADVFSFKHRYVLFALDQDVVAQCLDAIHKRCRTELEIVSGKRKSKSKCICVVPLKIFISTQSGRQYLAAYSFQNRKTVFFRLDTITKVKQTEAEPRFIEMMNVLSEDEPYIWGVSCGHYRTEHIEIRLKVNKSDMHIVHRLEREKRCGNVTRTAEDEWLFTADVYDSMELMPWIRTFIGRIVSLECSNKDVERCFREDLEAISAMYGGAGGDF